MKIRNKQTGQIIEVTEDQLADYGLDTMAKGGMIKRADGSYSRRGLWDNIRANKGSGKKPTKAMLAQEKKIRAAEKAYGGYMDMGGYMNPYMGYGGMYDMGGMYPMDMMAQGGINNPGFRALPEYVQEKIKDNMAYGGCKECGGKMQGGGTAKPSYNFPALMEKPTAMDSAVYRSNFNQMLKQDPYAVSQYQKMQKYGIPPTLDNETYTKALMWQNAYEDALSKLKKKESGGKLPKEILRARLESHMSPGQAQDYLNTYGMGGYLEEAGDGKWIQKATASIKRRGTEGVCTGSKFGGPGCPPGSKRYNLAKTFRKLSKSKKKEEGGYAQGGEYEMTDAEIAKLRSMGYKIKEV
jgi:hypothetical protein